MQFNKQQLEPYMEQLTDSVRIEKGVQQGCLLSPCLNNLYTEHIMWNTWLDEAQAGIKSAGRSVSLRYADDAPLMADSEEPESLEGKGEEWKTQLKTQY